MSETQYDDEAKMGGFPWSSKGAAPTGEVGAVRSTSNRIIKKKPIDEMATMMISLLLRI